MLGKGGVDMNLKDRVLRYIPKKYQDRLGDVEMESGLIDDCIYMIYTSENYVFEDGGRTLPCKSFKEIVHFITKFTEPA